MTSSSDIITPIRLLRSNTSSKRPLPSILLPGQPAVNIEPDSTGLYFLDSTGEDIFKVGPCHVGSTPPNHTPAPGGQVGLCKGETWLDTTNPNSPLFKVWDGANWSTPGNSLSGFIWVDQSGDDANLGNSPEYPKKTIKSALEGASEGTTILVSPGTYLEQNPIAFPESNISLIGSSKETTHIELVNDEDLFYVRGNCLIQGFSFKGSPSSSKSVIAFSGTGAGYIDQPPLVKDCQNNITGSIGISVDGVLADNLKSVRAENFIQNIPDGTGFSVFGKGFLEINNCETSYADISVLATSGGVVTISNSKSLYGDYGLVADGTSPVEQSGEIAALDPSFSFIQVDNLTEVERPYEGQVLTVGGLFYEVSSFIVNSQGLGYACPPTVTVSIGSGPSAQAAEGLAIIEDGKLVEIQVLNPGYGYRLSDTITVTLTGGLPIIPADAEVVINPLYYTVLNSTEITGNSCIVEIAENLPYVPIMGSTVEFFRMSKISASSHYMGYVGSGNSTPYQGGVANHEKQVVEENGGRVYFSSIDQSGNFKVGKDFMINQITGEISGSAFLDSVISAALPYIKSLN